MASNGSDFNSYIPQWKKELIIRRRTFGRAITSAGGMMKLTVTCPSSLRPDSVPQSCCKQQHCPLQSSNCTAQDFHSESPVSTMRLLDADLTSDLIVSGVKCNSDCVSDVKVKMVEEKSTKKPTFTGMEKQKEEKQLRTFAGLKTNGKDDEYQSDSSEELQYGPGIVNKLKSKYLSLTLRDNAKHSVRPSLANLRRATSLENMLDDESNRNQDKPHFIKKAYHSSTYKGAKISQHHAKYLGLTRGSESMKRARSMDTLLKNDTKNHLHFSSKQMLNKNGISNGIIAPSIINEDIIIVDNNSHAEEEKCNNFVVEDKELPPPDVVKQTVKIFEPSINSKTTLAEIQGKKNISVKCLNNTAKMSNVDKSVSKLVKPSLSPKPVLSPEKRLIRPKIASPKRVVPVVTPIKDKLKSPGPISDKEKELLSPSRISSPPIKSSPVKSPSYIKISSSPTKVVVPSKGFSDKTPPPQSPVKSCTSPIKASPVPPVVTSPSHTNNIDHINDESFKYISQKAIEGICKESTSVTFAFSEGTLALNKSYLPNRTVAQATNTTLISSQNERSPPPSPAADIVTSPSKQVAIIRPVIANKIQNLTEVEIEKNLINTVKTIETKIISSKHEGESGFNCVSEKTNLWDKKPWQSQNTMVFNFSSRDTVPDYIENDGLNQTKRTSKFNGNNKDEADAGSGEEDWEPPTVCNVRFIGDNIVINGKSNLRKEPKQHKLRIQFNDEATTMFEYPAEESELLSEEAPSIPATSPPTIPLVGSTLSSYTPSKSGNHDTFELGVTRAAPAVPQAQQSENSSNTSLKGTEPQEYLKPADIDSETTWSQENSSDILF